MSYIVPKDDTTITDRKAFRQAAREAGLARAVEKLGMSRDEFCVRQLLNIVDAGSALEQWNTPLLAAPIGTAYSVFQAAAPVTLANNKVAVFYGIAIETAPVPVARLIFRLGGVLGNVIAEFDLEQIVNADTVEGYFNEPICIDPTTIFDIQVTARVATGAIARIQLMNFLIEPVGQIIA